jgi:hypothetical protein
VGVKLEKRFLWKNETIEKLNDIDRTTVLLPDDEKIFLSLAQDLILNWQKKYNHLNYYHEV